MPIKTFQILSISQLTSDIYEIVYKVEGLSKMIPGQFVTFLIDKIGGRAYSILKQEDNKITLIIKKWEIENGGRGGSKFLCEQNIGDTLRGIGPSGHFILKPNCNNKLFIGTGAGFVPLYNMIISALENKIDCKLQFIFGVRYIKDIFYLNQLKTLKNKYSNFDYNIYVSRDKDLHEFELNNPEIEINSGYTTNYLTKKHILQYKEVYICGAPAMINSTVEKLEKHGFKDRENIFYEKY